MDPPGSEFDDNALMMRGESYRSSENPHSKHTIQQDIFCPIDSWAIERFTSMCHIPSCFLMNLLLISSHQTQYST